MHYAGFRHEHGPCFCTPNSGVFPASGRLLGDALSAGGRRDQNSQSPRNKPWSRPQVLRHAGKKQMLIFVHSRKETAKTAKYLKETAMANETLARFMSVRRWPMRPAHPLPGVANWSILEAWSNRGSTCHSAGEISVLGF